MGLPFGLRADTIFNTPSVAATIEQQAADLQARRIKDIALRWNAYYGKLPDSLEVTRKGLTVTNDNVKYPLSRIIVDKGVSFLFGSDVEFQVGGKPESAEEEWLDAAWNVNKKQITLHKMATNGGISGDCFVKMQIDPAKKYPRLIVLDPQSVYALWNPDDYEDVEQWRIQWTGIDTRTGKARVRRQTISRLTSASWQIRDEVSIGDSNRWEEMGRQVWPYAWSPLFHCQNLPAPNEFYGVSDLEDDVIELNKDVNFSASNIKRILRFHAHPKTWGRGFRAKELDTSVDSIIALPSDTGELRNLEMQSDLGSSIEFLAKLVDIVYEVARIPQVAVGRTEDLGALSGVALKILYGPILEKTGTKQLLYGDLLKEINKRLLEVGNVATDAEVENVWPPILPTDEKSEAEAGALYKQLGVSAYTVLQRLGFDPDAEQERRAEEDAQKVQTMQQAGERFLTQFDRGQFAPEPGTRGE